jgi:hypothetical protein
VKIVCQNESNCPSAPHDCKNWKAQKHNSVWMKIEKRSHSALEGPLLTIQIHSKQTFQEIIVAPRGQKIPNVAHFDPCLECICTLGTAQLSAKLMSLPNTFHLVLVFGLNN